MTEYNQTAFAPGTHVVVSDQFGSWLGTTGVKVGTTLVVTGCRETLSSGYQVRVAHLAEFTGDGATVEIGEFGSDWFSPVARQPILFSLTKDTSREYAKRSNSTKLAADQQRVLYNASQGTEVDVWDFHLAATAALSLAATRAGQSMARREYTKMARHLLYISGAVIANALNGLPPVEPGQRSPKIASLEKEVAEASAREQETYLLLEAERERTAALIREKTDLEAQVARQAEGARVNRTQFDYAMSLLDTESRFKVVGFGDAVSWLAE